MDLATDERTMLLAFLAFQRQTLRAKAGGLTAEQLRTPLAPSSLTLAGLLKHMALVEDDWFGEVLRGQPPREPWASVDWEADRDWEFHSALGDPPGDLVALFDRAVASSDEILAAEPDLEVLAVRGRHGRQPSLRWILLHLIEEYARHNGHADLIRESLDGRTGT
ncbi:DinB family protein [Nocardioides sp. zg-DK7169]|uniref:DinB family protein n=1 Tax=Nocardioides sp. zg-DK7169 TaxID=2736600 RepID=UPI00155443B9|nr:DinB family protein [Nocardioides sp. zg-DK7169]NPC95751.1 DinB family protein [Nocardioides sp. zg-DK7169]